MKRPAPRPCPTPRKHRHASEREALAHAKSQARADNAAGRISPALFGYRCACRSWHVTHWAEFEGRANVVLVDWPRELQEWAMGRAVAS